MLATNADKCLCAGRASPGSNLGANSGEAGATQLLGERSEV